MQNILTNNKHSKQADMPYLKLKQLWYESDTWKRLLGFMMEENIHLKNRLSEILKEKFDKYLLEEVDSFQGRFIKADELIVLLRHEITEFDKLLEREIFVDGKITPAIERELKKLHNNINTAEKHFSNLKSEFNNFLSDNIL